MTLAGLQLDPQRTAETRWLQTEVVRATAEDLVPAWWLWRGCSWILNEWLRRADCRLKSWERLQRISFRARTCTQGSGSPHSCTSRARPSCSCISSRRVTRQASFFWRGLTIMGPACHPKHRHGIGFQAPREFVSLLCMQVANLSGTDYGERIYLSLQWVSGCRLPLCLQKAHLIHEQLEHRNREWQTCHWFSVYSLEMLCCRIHVAIGEKNQCICKKICPKW
jgi:hypothetical protein